MTTGGAEQDRIERVAETVKQMADRIEESLMSGGYVGYPDKPADRDWKRGYGTACKDVLKALRE